MQSKKIIYTIGHSNHEIEHFLSLLNKHEISVVYDVRSLPYSRWQQYNRETLERSLKAEGMRYVFMGDKLGARNPSCYQQGRVQYDCIARTQQFQEGLERIQREVERGHRIVLMCAEKDPINCHRTILISRKLHDRGFEIFHILEDGKLETQKKVIDRIIERHGLRQQNLFDDDNAGVDLEEEAYARQEKKIAHVIDKKVAGGRR